MLQHLLFVDYEFLLQTLRIWLDKWQLLFGKNLNKI
jgi:hypothetical protein